MDINNLPDNIDDLKKIIIDLFQQLKLSEERCRLFINEIFGSSSEKYKFKDIIEGHQLLPFLALDEIIQIQHDSQNNEDGENDEETEKTRKPGKKKKGRKPLPPHLTRVEKIIDLLEEEKFCECGTPLICIGEEVSEKLDYVPATLRVVRTVRRKYACPACEGVDSPTPVKIAPAPIQVIPKGIATAGLITHVIISKFVDALPFYRQHRQFLRLGIDIARSTMAAWTIYVAELCKPLVDLLVQDIRSGPIINMDETTIQVLKEPDRKNTTKSYMWVFIGGDPQYSAAVFKYDPSRSGDVPCGVVGPDYCGYIQTDGYGGYNSLGNRDGIIHLGCLVHARRKFIEVIKALPKGTNTKGSTTQIVLDHIRDLYRIEKFAADHAMTPDQIRDLRQDKAVPILGDLKTVLDQSSATTHPSGRLHQAISYALGQWNRLVRYTENGILKPDNNLVENAIRPLAVGRKNWLFAGSPRGAEAYGVLLSVIETAKLNGLEPYVYLRHLLEKIPHAKGSEDLEKLLPKHFTPETLPRYK